MLNLEIIHSFGCQLFLEPAGQSIRMTPCGYLAEVTAVSLSVLRLLFRCQKFSVIHFRSFSSLKFHFFSGYYHFNTLWKYDPKSTFWTWISGSDTQSQSNQYDALGVFSPTAQIGSRYGSNMWIDHENIIWIFGGCVGDVTYRNDMWKFRISTGEWAFAGGMFIHSGSPQFRECRSTNRNQSTPLS